MKNGHDMRAAAALLAKEKWSSSGLSDALAKRLALTPVTDAQTLAPNLLPLKAVQIPYFDFSGRRTKFFRVRYLEAPKGLAGLVEKPPRYAQATGSLNEIYVPPILHKQTWSEIISDVSIQITITEGEFKAACACSRGIVCLALGGVSMWRSNKRGLALLPQLEKIPWMGRHVRIAFDSDAATNPDVVRAQLQLASELATRGALIKIMSVPPKEGGGKQGLDDYLLPAESADDVKELWERLEESAHLLDASTALWKLNSEVCVIKSPSIIVNLATGDKMNARVFKEIAYANRSFKQRSVTSAGEEKTKDIPLAPEWLAWPCRHELKRITFKPGQPRITQDNEFNEWCGWAVQPVKGDIGPWRDLLDYMFEGKPAERKWFERWCAYPLQNPGVKMYSSVLVWGSTQGTGKTAIGYALMDIYGTKAPYDNSREIKNKDLDGGGNVWAHNKQFVVGDEISSQEKRRDSDYIKSLITREQVEINIKYVPQYWVPDYINYYFTSQHPDALFLEDTDRRNFVHEAPKIPKPKEFYDAFDRWRSAGGAAHLFHYLLHLDLGDFSPKAHAMQTDAKRAMILDSKSDLGMWVVGLREDPTGALHVLGSKASNGACLLTSEQLRRCYDPEKGTKITAIGLGKELKRSGFGMVNGGKPINTEVGAQRLYIVRNTEFWQKQNFQKCAAHWNEFFGAGANKLTKKGGGK